MFALAAVAKLPVTPSASTTAAIAAAAATSSIDHIHINWLCFVFGLDSVIANKTINTFNRQRLDHGDRNLNHIF